MKKITLLLSLFLSVNALFAQAFATYDDSRLFIHPGREVFVNFPSESLQSKYIVTFYLPEDFVPLKHRYPVIVALGVTSKQFEQVAEFQKEYPAIVVGINFEEKDYVKTPDDIIKFLSRELLPYVDTNYLTKTGPENRILAVKGAMASAVALRVAQNPQLFGALTLVSPGSVWEKQSVPQARTLVIGTQGELALAQQAFEQAGKTYGPDFALRYIPQEGEWFDWVQPDYLWAAKDSVQLAYIQADVNPNKISLAAPQAVALRMWAVLVGGGLFHYVPQQLRISPPYLTWQPGQGSLQIVPGAQPGTVRVGNLVDKTPFSVKIKVKK